MRLDELFALAVKASEYAYSPYSNYKVGAAVQTMDGSIFTGANIENASYSATICAERVAISKAVSEGHVRFKAIAIYVNSEKLFPPCGICRQFMSEFSADMDVIYGNDEKLIETNLTELLPQVFSL
jgi:cytidine deaminase